MEFPSDSTKATVKSFLTTMKPEDGSFLDASPCEIGSPPCEPGSETKPASPDALVEIIQRIFPGWSPEKEVIQENSSHRSETSLPNGFLDTTKSASWWCRSMGIDCSHHPSVERLCLVAGRFLSAAIRNERASTTWLVIHGAFGTGKSHVMRWVVRAFNDWIWDFILSGKTKWGSSRKPLAYAVNWSKFVRQGEHENANTSLLDLRSVDLLAVDDIGSESDQFRGGANLSLLRDLLEDSRNKWVMISTNVVPGSWAKVFGPRVADRLSAAVFVDLTGVPSYRPKKKLK